MKNFTAADMPKNGANTGGVEVEPVKDMHTDQINAAAGAEKGENPAGKTAPQVPVNSDATKEEAPEPETDYSRLNAAEDAVADETTERRQETGVSKTTANREAKKVETRRKKTTS